MGMHHNNAKTYPCLGQAMAFCTLDKAIDVAEKVMLVQSMDTTILRTKQWLGDYGDRTNRKHARMKYTVLDLGLEKYARTNFSF